MQNISPLALKQREEFWGDTHIYGPITYIKKFDCYDFSYLPSLVEDKFANNSFCQ